MPILYGYYKNIKGEYDIHMEHAEVVKKVYTLYLDGYSIDRIVKYLENRGIESPACKAKWTPQAIANMLSNNRYIPIVTEEIYIKIQNEREKRSSKTTQNKRKATRYNSQNVLSGLFVCGECGMNYRRITRRSGEAVWRCADKVDHGRSAHCHNLHTVTESEIKNMLQEVLGLEVYDDCFIKAHVEKVEITSNDIQILLK